MTNDIGEHLRKLTSSNGRHWLSGSREGADASQHDLPFGSVGGISAQNAARSAQHQSVVVSIPDVAALNAKAAGVAGRTAEVQAAAMEQTKAVNALRRQTKIVDSLPPLHQAPPAPKMATVARTVQRMVPAPAHVPGATYPELEVNEVRSVPQPVVPQPTVSQPPKVKAPPAITYPESEPVETKPAPKSDDAVKAARALQTKSSSDSISKIADEIMHKYPVAASSIVMIAGSQASLHADETCARVAAELASRKLGRVLLIDSDFEGRRLTKASGMSKQAGLSEIMNIALPWDKAILKSGSSQLDFMAAGSCAHKRWTPKETLRESIAEMRGDYQFICVSVGDAHSTAGALWSEMSDGAFLVVSATHSSDDVAASAVELLRDNGARMVGCIVADVPATKAA